MQNSWVIVAYLHAEAMLALNTIICPYVQPPVHMPALAVGVCELNFIGCLGLLCHTLVIGHLCCQLTPAKTSYSWFLRDVINILKCKITEPLSF